MTKQARQITHNGDFNIQFLVQISSSTLTVRSVACLYWSTSRIVLPIKWTCKSQRQNCRIIGHTLQGPFFNLSSDEKTIDGVWCNWRQTVYLVYFLHMYCRQQTLWFLHFDVRQAWVVFVCCRSDGNQFGLELTFWRTWFNAQVIEFLFPPFCFWESAFASRRFMWKAIPI